MKEIIVIRHGEKDGDELTPDGILACHSLAKSIGVLNYAFASERNRAIQTAQFVSGLPVTIDARANVPSFPDSEIDKLVQVQKVHPLGIIGAIWENIELVNDAQNAGIGMQGMVYEIMSKLKDGERALIVSHDGTMVGLEKVLKNESFDSVDHSFNALEGFSINQDLVVKPFKI
jgi:broad specificity phosphatase PhoE